MTRAVDIQYLNVLREVLEEGTLQGDRTSVGSSIQTFGKVINFNTKGRFAPFIQHRAFGPKTSFREWIWMMRGETDANILKAQNVHIWDEHSSRAFLDSRNLQHLNEGDIGKSYGYQFRNFGGETDQLANVVHALKTDPLSRHHTISIWNPNELDQAPLKPCSYLYEFMVEGNELHLYQHMRSADILYGVPYNMSFGTYFQHAMANVAGLQTGKYMLSMTNCHIYNNQIPLVEELLSKEFNPLTPCPIISLEKNINTVMGIESLRYEDFKLEDFAKGDPIKNVALAV